MKTMLFAATCALAVVAMGANAHAGFSWCAQQDGWCDLPGAGTVRYGVNGVYYTVHYDHGEELPCTDSTFGNPAYGTKDCSYQLDAWVQPSSSYNDPNPGFDPNANGYWSWDANGTFYTRFNQQAGGRWFHCMPPSGTTAGRVCSGMIAPGSSVLMFLCMVQGNTACYID